MKIEEFPYKGEDDPDLINAGEYVSLTIVVVVDFDVDVVDV